MMLDPIQIKAHSQDHKRYVSQQLSQQETLRQIQEGQGEIQSSGLLRQAAGWIEYLVAGIAQALTGEPCSTSQTDLQTAHKPS